MIKLSKCVIVFILFFLFLNFFGLPSFKRYMDEKTIFTEQQEFYDNDEVPAISIRTMSVLSLVLNNTA